MIDVISQAIADRYRIVREIGAGGMATVYLARDVKHERDVAVKVLRPDLAATIGTQQFLHEIHLTAALQHPHILPLFDSGEAGGLLYYVMPFVEGETLRARLEREEQLPIEDALHIAATIAGALDYAHRHDVIHCDLKPENILLHEGMPLLMDFGIARAVTKARSADSGNESIGTPGYMSPEQATGDHPIDGRSDIYALAAVTHEMLTGSPPHIGSTSEQVIARKLTETPSRVRATRPNIGASIDAAIAKGLEKLPADRWQRAAQFAQALTPAPRFGVFDQRTKRAIIGTAAAILLVLGARELWHRRPLNAADLNRSTVAVVPFRVSGADPSVRYLGEGVTDLLGTLLMGEGGPRALESNRTLFAWRRAGGSTEREIAVDALRRLGRDLGAGYVITGEITGPPSRLVLTASLMDVGSGRIRSRARAEGSVDSVTSIVDRLTAELLVRESGETPHRLAGLTTNSLDALRAYLDGRAAMRRGNYSQALGHFQRSLEIDSTFALAAIYAHRSAGWMGANRPSGVEERAQRLAWAGRHRLSARDQLLIEWMNPARAGESFRDRLALYERNVEAIPDQSDVWIQLGDALTHNASVRGIPDWRARAEAAFRRALAIDTTGDTEALIHLIQLAAEARDKSKLREYVRLFERRSALAAQLTRGDSAVLGMAAGLRWLTAMALGDSATVRQMRTNSDGDWSMALYAQYFGFGVDDAELALRRLLEKAQTSQQRNALLGRIIMLLRNQGRHKEATRLQQQIPVPDSLRDGRLRGAMGLALYWDGPALAAESAAREMIAGGWLPLPLGRMQQDVRPFLNWCVLEQWRIAQGNTADALRSIQLMRAAAADSTRKARAKIATACALLLDVLIAERTNAPDLQRRLEALEHYQINEMWGFLDFNIDAGASLAAARIWESFGNLERAFAAIRRRGYLAGPPPPLFVTTFLRNEARLCAKAGDRECALQRYQHYLALRSKPDPELKPQSDSIRAEYQRLLAVRPE